MSTMTHAELKKVMRNIQDCEDYLTGKKTSDMVMELANVAARRAVMERMHNLVERLRDAGLNLVDEDI